MTEPRSSLDRLDKASQNCLDAAVAQRYALKVRMMALRIGVRKVVVRMRPPPPRTTASLPVLTLLALPLQAPFLLLAMGFAAGPRVHPPPSAPPEAAMPAASEAAAVVVAEPAPAAIETEPPPPSDPPAAEEAVAAVAEPASEPPPPADCDPGRACAPIAAEVPSLVLGSTRKAADDAIETYGCAPEISEPGPEVWYQVTLDRPGHLTARLDENTIDGVDIDVQLLRTRDPASCLARADADLQVDLPAGTYFLVLDTCAANGVDQPGPYRLTLEATARP